MTGRSAVGRAQMQRLHCRRDRRDDVGMSNRPQKITFAEMREQGVRGILVYCADYRCSTGSIAERVPDTRIIQGCGKARNNPSDSTPCPRIPNSVSIPGHNA